MVPPDPDVTRACTPRGAAYGAEAFARQRESLFPRTWHCVAAEGPVPAAAHVVPMTLLPGVLDEPLLWTGDAGGTVRCLSNVCTHRGKVLVDAPGPRNAIRCDYHGRCFELDGRLKSAPGFEGARDFPQASDDLPAVAHGEWGGLRFCSLEPALPFAKWIAPIVELMPHWRAPATPPEVRDYEFDANWALYVDNYLESFHLPYVHPALSRTLSVTESMYETWDHGSLQLGIAKEGEPALELPKGHRFAGRRIGGAYAWLFPCTMFNFYPWGVSVNVVQPLGPVRTRVRYLSCVARPELRGKGAGANLDTVEHEDQGVVLATQRGVHARMYRGGRYAPAHETGVHLFHTLLARMS